MVDYLNERELERFMSAIESRRKKDIFQTQLELGCRVGELTKLKLRWFDGRFVTVYDEKSSKGRDQVYRDCVISKELAEELQNWYFENRKVKRRGPAMFVYETPRTLNRWMKSIGKRAGFNDKQMEKMHTHTLRHTFVVWSQSKGWNLKSICQQTGDTPETILEHYSDLSIDDRARQWDEKPLFEDIKDSEKR